MRSRIGDFLEGVFTFFFIAAIFIIVTCPIWIMVFIEVNPPEWHEHVKYNDPVIVKDGFYENIPGNVVRITTLRVIVRLEGGLKRSFAYDELEFVE